MNIQSLYTGARPAFRIVVVYALVSGVYIFTSDWVLELFVPDVKKLSELQTTKGLVFILVTALLLYVLVRRHTRMVSRYYQQILDTEREAEERLRRSKQEYMSLFNHSPLPKWLFDPETLDILLVNEAACRIYGYSEADYMAMTLRDIRPPEDIPILMKYLAEPDGEHGKVLPWPIRHRKKNGEIIYVKVKTSFVLWNGRRVQLASAVDVTAEMAQQQRLADSNERLQRAGAIAGLGYWTNDLVHNKIEWSEEMYHIVGRDPEVFSPTLDNLRSVFHPDEVFDLELQYFAEDGFREYERRIITSEGETKWILERLYLTRDENGNPMRLEGIALDITRRKLQEQQVWESNERFKLLARATVEAIIDWDVSTGKVLWGEGFETIFGFNLDEERDFWTENIHPDDRERILLDLKDAIRDPARERFNAEFRFLKADGETAFVQHRGFFIRDQKGRVTRAVGAMTDLTETLDRMHKIESQDRALREIAWRQSHMVRAPLANLLGFLKLYRDQKATGGSADEYLDYISVSAEQLDSVLREIVEQSTGHERNEM
ncbi:MULTISPECIES: PAS domain-containing protein [unclassified Flavobacterium]|uniref:PAS domain-containing protein n=1 Tax=unclassified Flavobacterium TaxID=196869 RepID=UPI001F1470D7|nr:MULTISPECIES: PAS domain-containing protein [unclassified Flavobacterium]UMY64927.1 PAS domain-containing protein [Flavobacterium sp. HJ-32-4]